MNSELLDKLLGDESELEKIRQRTLQWWNEKCDPKAVANYIMKELTSETKD